jgi:RNA polymerase sigma-70 factor (ECF subfamily)
MRAGGEMAVALEPVAAEQALTVQDGEAEWVAAARRGDRDGFTRIYQRYAPVVHGALIARVPPHDARDLVQDVFVIAMRRMDVLREAESVGGWLLAIARARAADYWRAARPRGELPEAAASDPPRAEAAQVLAALRDLPDAYREVLAMRLVEGLTGPEIAERTGLTPGSVRVNLHRGLKLLREKLGWEGSSDE